MVYFVSATGVYWQDFLGQWFITHPVEVMTVIFSVFLILLILNVKTLRESFGRINRKILIVLILIFLLSFCFRNSL